MGLRCPERQALGWQQCQAVLRASWLPRQVEGVLIMLLLTALTVRLSKPGFSTCQGDQASLDWKGECPSPWQP